MFVLTAFLLLPGERKCNHLNVYQIIRCGNFTSKVEQYGYCKLAYKWRSLNCLLGTHLEYFFYCRAISQCKSFFSARVWVYNFSTSDMILRWTIIIYYKTLPQWSGRQFGLTSWCDRCPTYRQFHPTLPMVYLGQIHYGFPHSLSSSVN